MHPEGDTMSLLDCSDCDHGWHATPCDGIEVAGGVALRCECPGGRQGAPSPTEYQAGARSRLAEVLRAEAIATRHASLNHAHVQRQASA